MRFHESIFLSFSLSVRLPAPSLHVNRGIGHFCITSLPFLTEETMLKFHVILLPSSSYFRVVKFNVLCINITLPLHSNIRMLCCIFSGTILKPS
jgi:hypothetical protein